MTEAATATPTKTPIYKRWWFWALVAVVAVIAIASSQGSDDGETGAIPSTGGPQPTAEAPEAAPPAEAEPPAADDPLTDDGWTVSDIQVEESQFGTSVTARVTNNEATTRTGVWTLTIFSGGQRIYEAMGSGSDVEAGQTATVTFVGTTESLQGDPATYTYEFQSDI